ncbi:MAG: Fic family protein [Nitrospirota bacterium]|nr:Fic family protein [Nitrospirota bacterium]MDH5585767.1 Fic family protein [Nitrospirota bacterium]MDH5774155.1 Fic family protein [Nitrospirota bacterium]
MNPKDYRSLKAGKALRTPTGYTAFIPAKLPPTLTYDNELVLSLSRADAALSELSGLGRHLPNPHLLIAPYVRREAVLSSRIEGTRASLSDLLIDEMEEPKQVAGDQDVQEVRNYVMAMECGLARLRKLPLSLRLVREIHGRLMKGVRGDRATPGEFRRSQNWIGPSGSTIETAPYVPPPPEYLDDLLGDWEQFLHERKTFPDLIQCAIMHEQFEAIHPFLDGNGRLGRLLITLFLIERGRLAQPLLYLSAYIEAHRQDYYDLLRRVRTHGDWKSWLQFFLTGVTEIALEAVGQADHLMSLREKFRTRLQEKSKALALLDELFLNPYMSVAKAERVLKVSNPTARQAVLLLQKKGMLEEITGRTWGKLYLAKPIMDTIEEKGKGR